MSRLSHVPSYFFSGPPKCHYAYPSLLRVLLLSGYPGTAHTCRTYCPHYSYTSLMLCCSVILYRLPPSTIISSSLALLLTCTYTCPHCHISHILHITFLRVLFALNISRDPGPRNRFHDLITTTTTGRYSCLISICFRLNLGACDVLYFYVNRAYCLPYVSWLPQPVLC